MPTASTAALVKRLTWTIGARLAFLILLLTAIAFFYLRGRLTEYPVSLGIVFVTLAVAFAHGAVSAAVVRSGRFVSVIADTQIILDQITWSAIVYVSGGATSGATSFYALTTLLGAMLTGLRGAALGAISGVAAYAALCGAFWLEWVHPPPDQGAANYATTFEGLIYPFLVNMLGIVVVALLAGYLAERLRVAGGALAEATRRALDAERLASLGRLAAGLAHEIRNPLGSIRGSIELLREAPALCDEDRVLCDIVLREAQRLNNLVTDMVDLTRRSAPILERVDVAALAREVVALASAESRVGGDVRVSYEGPDGSIVARCDGAQMRQVLWNLVRNGIQASAAGMQVTVRVATNDKTVTLGVEDSGPGIRPEDREQLFDAFYTTRAHGTGIGLAVVKRIVDEHATAGARIVVSSPSDAGARFEVVLPIARADVPAPAPSRP